MVTVRFASILIALVVSGPALACSCVVDLERSYETAQQVRIVRILSTHDHLEHPTLGYVSSATFEITETLKGDGRPVPGELFARGKCSDGFEPGALYLISLGAGEPLVNICSGSFSVLAGDLESDPRVALARRTLRDAK